MCAYVCVCVCVCVCVLVSGEGLPLVEVREDFIEGFTWASFSLDSEALKLNQRLNQKAAEAWEHTVTLLPRCSVL